ncbi:hypothetical protein [Ferranicluibacter rubi]|uniref:Uncharacterized protein n=1 Tax=Ferranicluibacter rubi TaxID=2715133 RepID=A0AA43ZDB0_9HYPH|nr:hypothetical protein [Ferranicluibacter rubi]NHT75717.1 hypothetical protein [Ferranicluibacter rubi]
MKEAFIDGHYKIARVHLERSGIVSTTAFAQRVSMQMRVLMRSFRA